MKRRRNWYSSFDSESNFACETVPSLQKTLLYISPAVPYFKPFALNLTVRWVVKFKIWFRAVFTLLKYIRAF